jgi:energy-coupling factor transport system ATP-binding protein
MNNGIDIQQLIFSYHENMGERVLKNVDLTIHEGEFVAILGHNGSGKSTLAKHFNAILLPSGGSVTVFSMDTRKEELLYKIRQQIGMVFQNPDNQLVATVVEEDVAFGPENLGVPPKEIRNRVNEALADVHMTEFIHHASHRLSGGQKQRVAIAGCLAMRPRCIVLDEPTAMLDPMGRKDVMETIKRLNQKNNTTVVLITHYMNEAAMADRVVVMDRGRIILEGKPKEVFSHVKLLKSVGLDVPQTTEIMYLLKQEGVDVPDNILTDNECVDALLHLLER